MLWNTAVRSDSFGWLVNKGDDAQLMSAQSEIILRAEGLTLGYGQRIVLSSVTFEVQRAERWFIVGPNGQGKTTLLRGILGLLPAPGLHRHPSAMHHEHIGFVPQRCDLNPALPTTVREFVLLGSIGQKVSRADQSSR